MMRGYPIIAKLMICQMGLGQGSAQDYYSGTGLCHIGHIPDSTRQTSSETFQQANQGLLVHVVFQTDLTNICQFGPAKHVAVGQYGGLNSAGGTRQI